MPIGYRFGAYLLYAFPRHVDKVIDVQAALFQVSSKNPICFLVGVSCLERHLFSQ